MYRIEQLKKITSKELITIAQELKIDKCESMKKEDLIYKILDQQASIPTPSKSTNQTKEKKNKKVSTSKTSKKSSKDYTPPKKTTEKNNSKSTPTSKPKQKKIHKPNTTQHNSELDGIIEGEGVLELVPDGYGFLRSLHYNYQSSPDDIYVSHAQIRTWQLQTGDTVRGKLRLPRDGEKYFALLKPELINGKEPEEIKTRVPFASLPTLFPEKKINIISSPTQYTTRIMDLLCPIGKGQRSLIVAPPNTGKTTLMHDLITSISKNHPEIHLIILLIDERSEEANHMKRTFSKVAEVVSSTFDQKADNHTKVAEMVLEKAKRMTESGHDVCIFLDSITRLARAYNKETRSSGRTLSGGMDINALQKPKRFFGAARNIEGGGSLTIIATALIETGSRMDEFIFQEFKGTGNMECQLATKLANKGIYPAINVPCSKTRNEELVQHPEIMKKIKMLRHAMADTKSEEVIALLRKNMQGTKDNTEFLASLHD